MEKKTIIINGDNFSDIESFYTEIDHVLAKDLTWQTGHNFNAFNDLLRGGFGVHDFEEPFKLIWKNSEKNKMDMGFGATIKYYEGSLSRCHPSNKQNMHDYLELAKQHKGETLFDILLDIIKEHSYIELSLE